MDYNVQRDRLEIYARDRYRILIDLYGDPRQALDELLPLLVQLGERAGLFQTRTQAVQFLRGALGLVQYRQAKKGEKRTGEDLDLTG
jgi:hypothetical protein